MKLRLIETGHWEVAKIPYPNKIVKTKNQKRALSPLIHPNDPKEYFNGLTLGEEETLTTDQVNQNLLNNTPQKINPNQIQIDDPKLLKKQQEAKKKLIDPNVKQIQNNLGQLNQDITNQTTQTNQDIVKQKEMSKTIQQLTNQLNTINSLNRWTQSKKPSSPTSKITYNNI